MTADRIRLEREPAFHVGALHVTPRTGEISDQTTTLRLEPRVMQMLIALVRAKGDAVSRDELIELCWEGRIVGEAAINRVAARLRQIAAQLGPASFEIETLPKIGYRLSSVDTPVPDPVLPAPSVDLASTPPSPFGLSRRTLGIGAVSLAALGGATALIATRRDTPPLTGDAKRLYEMALDADRQGRLEQNQQAIAYLQQAVRQQTDHPQIWGALALGWARSISGVPPEKIAGVVSQAQSAAARATALDPGNGDAIAARLTVEPRRGRWAGLIAQAQDALGERPDSIALHMLLGELLADVGNWTDALRHLQAALKLDSYIPRAWLSVLMALWSLNRLAEADATIDRAYALWPTHPWVWLAKFNFLALSDRSEAALALIRQSDLHPSGPLPIPQQLAISAAQALSSGNAAERARAAGDFASAVSAGQAGTFPAAGYLARLGAARESISVLRRYYFGGAFAGSPPLAPPRPLEPRATLYLFLPPLARLADTPDYRRLTRDLGLDAYWQATGKPADTVIT